MAEDQKIYISNRNNEMMMMNTIIKLSGFVGFDPPPLSVIDHLIIPLE